MKRLLWVLGCTALIAAIALEIASKCCYGKVVHARADAVADARDGRGLDAKGWSEVEALQATVLRSGGLLQTGGIASALFGLTVAISAAFVQESAVPRGKWGRFFFVEFPAGLLIVYIVLFILFV